MTFENHQKIKDNIRNIAEAIQQHIKLVTGGIVVPFNLIIFSDEGLFQTISNQPPEIMLPALEEALAFYKTCANDYKSNVVIH